MSCRRYKNGKQGDHKRSFKRRTSQRNGTDGCCGDDLKSDEAIGAKADVEVDFYEHRLKRGDIILMCTDGLSNMVEDEELFHIVQGGRDIVESGQALIEAAKENGGTDNIGVVLIEPFADEVSVL